MQEKRGDDDPVCNARVNRDALVKRWMLDTRGVALRENRCDDPV